MNKYNLKEYDEIFDMITNTIENETGKKIFTMRLLKDDDETRLETIVIFEDRSVLNALLTIGRENDLLCCRFQGNWI